MKNQKNNALISAIGRVLFVFFAMLITSLVYGQSCANYTVTRSTGITYSSIASTGNSIPSWRNTYSPGSSGGANDDNRSYFINIGFDFWYLGVRYSQFSISTNGFIDFSSSTADGTGSSAYGYYNPAFSSTTPTALALCPFYCDLTTSAGSDPLGNDIKYLLSGAAPNRVLTVQWISMSAYGESTLSNLNFQVKIYESTGVIDFVYGTNTFGTNSWQYSCGINNSTISSTPTSTQLLTQQTANTSTFSNTVQNSLSTVPTTNSKITLTPTSPNGTPTSISFTSVSSTGMTINWIDNATNEIGYVIYNSTDNTNFTFVSQTSANTTSSIVSRLLPSTTYYWRVYAVTDGKLSTALTGSNSTSAAGNITSIRTGLWSSTTTWVGGVVPSTGDNVTIADGHTVTLDMTATCNSISVGQGVSGQFTIGNNTTARSFTVNTNIIVNLGATFTIGASAATHTISVAGNITNNGVFNLAPTGTSICNTTFNKIGNQTISGTGGTTNFNLITINMGTTSENILEVSSSNFTASTNFLTITNGTFKLSTSATVTAFTSNVTLTNTCRIWVNNSSAIINTTGGSITFAGTIQVSSGTLNIGNATDNNLTSSGGGYLIMAGGTVNIAGRFDRVDVTTTNCLYMSGGVLTLNKYGSTTSGYSPFMMDVVGSTFNMSAGTIIIERAGAANLGYLNTGGTVGTISGGTLQIGDGSTPASQTIQINSSINIPNLVVSNGVAVTAQLATNNINVLSDVTVNSGTLNANSLNITLGGNWSNSGTFTAGSGTVTFSGTAQTLSGTTTFNNLTLSTSGVKTLTTANCTVNGVLSMEGTATVSSTPTYGSAATLQYNTTTARNSGVEWITPFVATGGVKNANSGTITMNASYTMTSVLSLTGGKIVIGANTLTLNGSFSGSSSYGLVGSSTSNLSIGGTGTIGTIYFDQTTDGTTNNLANLTVSRTAQTVTLGNTLDVTGTVTLSNGTLASGGYLTLISNSSGTARIGQITGTGAITDSVNVQRYIPGGTNRRAWRFIAAPAAGQTFANSWQQNIHITGAGTGGTACPSLTQNSNGFDYNVTNTTTVYTYNEVTGAWSSIPNTTSTRLSSTTGYYVFIRGARTQGCSILTAPFSTPQDVVLKAKGIIKTGQVDVTLTYNALTGAGWNFLSNPYPSAIDWNNSTWSSARSSNINSTIYIWNPASGTSGQFASWHPIAGSVNGGSNIIQSGQAFFVKVSAASSISFQEAYKSTDQTTRIFGKTAYENNLKVQLLDTAVTDEAIIFTYPGANHNIDGFDGLKMSFGTGLIGTYTSSNDTLLTFNAIEPFTSVIDTVYLKTGLIANKTYSLNFKGVSSFSGNVRPYLYDKELALLTDLTGNSLYTFSTNTVSSSYSATRFYVVFANPSSLPVSLLSFNASKQDKNVELKWNTSSEINNSHFVVERSVDATHFNEIALVKGAGNSTTEKKYSVLDLQPDLNAKNYYRLKQIDFDGTFTYSKIQVIDFSTMDNLDKTQLVNISPNPVSGNTIQLAINHQSNSNLSVTIYDMMGRKLMQDVKLNSAGNQYSIPVGSIQQGVYFMNVYENDNLVDSEKFVVE